MCSRYDENGSMRASRHRESPSAPESFLTKVHPKILKNSCLAENTVCTFLNWSILEEIDSSSEPEIEEIGTCSIGMGSGSIGVGSGSYDIVMGLTEHLVPSESVNEYSDEDFEDDF